MNVRLLTIGVAAFAFAAGARPAAPQEAAIPGLEKRITLEHRGKFTEFIDRLRSSLGVNIHLFPRLKGDAELETEQEISLRDVTGTSALRWVLWLYRLDYVVQGGVVVVGRAEWLRAPVLRTYDVRPLLAAPQDSSGAQVHLHQGPAGVPQTVGYTVVTDDASESAVQRVLLIDLIKELVAPGTWEGAATAEFSIDYGLVVSHLPRVQDEVARFLGALGQLSPPMVTVTAEIVEGDEASLPLVRPGSPVRFSAKEIEGVIERLRGGKRSPAARTLQTSGAAGQRVHSILMDESAVVENLKGKDPVITTGIHDVSVLDCRPVLVGEGKFISVEARLSMGQTTDLEPVKTKNGDLSFREGTLTKVSTTFLIPNGGGALFALPARSTAAKRGQLCLLRASSDPPPPLAPRTIVHGAERPNDAALEERFKKIAPVTVDLEEATFEEFLKWFRTASGMNVVVDQEILGSRVSVHGKNLSLDTVLTLVLGPSNWGYLFRDEAVLISSMHRTGKDLALAVVDVRDVAYGLEDFPRPGAESALQPFTGEDLANFIKNTIDKNAWEEADGKQIQFEWGLLMIRNTPAMIQRCIRFVEDLRRSRLRTVSLRADTVLVPAAAADPILGRAGGDSFLIDDRQYEALMRAGTVQEQLGWTSFESQRTSMSWDRSLGYLRDWSEAGDPSSDAFLTQSNLDLRPTLAGDGRSVTLKLEYEDRRVMEVNTKTVRDLLIQTPLSTGVRMRTMLRIPDDKMALFKWSAPTKGAERQYRLLIVKPTVWREDK